MSRIVMYGCCLAVIACAPSLRESARAEDRLPDVPAAVKALAGDAQVLEIAQAGQDLPPGGHLQGIQSRVDAAHHRHLVFLSHDSNTVAYFLVAAIEDRPGGASHGNRVLHYQPLPSDGEQPPLRHAGGIQLVDNLLVVGVEDNQEKKRSQVQFWNVADPSKPAQLTHLTIFRSSSLPKEMTSGAVGLVERKHDYLLAVANWDSRAIDFYVSNSKTLVDPECKFSLATRWPAAAADTTEWQPDRVFGAYQAINLLADAQGRIFLLGFDTTAAGQDVVDVFHVILNQPPAVLQKVARRQIKLVAGNHFRFAGGAHVQGGSLQLLSSERNVAPQTRLNSVR